LSKKNETRKLAREEGERGEKGRAARGCVRDQLAEKMWGKKKGRFELRDKTGSRMKGKR